MAASDSTQVDRYLLRRWKEPGEVASWRFSLESIPGGLRRGFGSLDALVAYLEEVDGRTSPDVMEAARRPTIERFLHEVVPSLKDEDLHAFCARGRFRRVFAGQEVVRAGEVCDELLFVHRGLFRCYLLHNGQEHTRDFSPPHTLCTVFTSLITRAPSRLSLAAVEDAEVTAWPASYLLPLFDASLPWQTFARRLAEGLYLREERRGLSALLDGTWERYERLLTEVPSLAAQPTAPPWIASYLGVTPHTLARLHREQSRRPPEGGEARGL